MILAFAHPGLVVPDLDKARDFYQRMFGFTLLGEEGWEGSEAADRAIGLKGSATRGCMLAGHNCYLELWQYSAPAKTGPDPGSLQAHEYGVRHLAFYVDDCRREYQRFLELGGQALGEPTGSEEEGYIVYCRDPFGNIIELCEIPRPEENPIRLPGIDRLGNFSGTDD